MVEKLVPRALRARGSVKRSCVSRCITAFAGMLQETLNEEGVVEEKRNCGLSKVLRTRHSAPCDLRIYIADTYADERLVDEHLSDQVHEDTVLLCI
ncbi:hypothetical protein KC321_g48 [Hortaea werneckii]|nr:hypothetical protein KC321_g48 [Hortaea werneckii]